MTRYWFRPKRYGYGATPVTWEGWLATLAFTVIVAGSVILVTARPPTLATWLFWVALAGGGTWWFVRLARQRTDGDWHWRWGERTGPRNDMTNSGL